MIDDIVRTDNLWHSRNYVAGESGWAISIDFGEPVSTERFIPEPDKVNPKGVYHNRPIPKPSEGPTPGPSEAKRKALRAKRKKRK